MDRISVGRNYRYPAPLFEPIIERLFRYSISHGAIRLQFRKRFVTIGQGIPVCTVAPPSLSRFIWMLMRPDYRLPNQYTKGFWCCGYQELYTFLELLTIQKSSILLWWFNVFSRNPIRDHIVYRLFPVRVKRKIADHYNTNPEFMKLILGDTLEYTCAFFDGRQICLEDAQNRKISLVEERLKIGNNDDVLDLGCGWGQIAEKISAKKNCYVTGINITKNQIQYAQSQRSEKTIFYCSDYEEFESSKKYDRIYSIGMLEHIGKGKLDTYFRKLSHLLTEEGRVLVHCIVRTKEGSTNAWIDEEVFPGAYIASLHEIIKSVDRSNLFLESIYTHKKENYLQTLDCWMSNYYNNRDTLLGVLKCSLSEADAELVMRIWEFYFCGSKLAFSRDEGYCYNVQIVMTQQMRGLQKH